MLQLQVLGEALGLESFPTMIALHIPRLPFLGAVEAKPRVVVRLVAQLGADLPRNTSHCLRFDCVRLEACTVKQVHQNPERLLELLFIDRGNVAIIGVEQCQEELDCCANTLFGGLLTKNLP